MILAYHLAFLTSYKQVWLRVGDCDEALRSGLEASKKASSFTVSLSGGGALPSFSTKDHSRVSAPPSSVAGQFARPRTPVCSFPPGSFLIANDDLSVA